MARKRERIFALVGAILFLTSSLGLSVAVIWGMYQDNHNKNNNTAQTATQNNKNKLAGTQLQNFTPTGSVPALEATDTKPGSGAEVKAGDTVTVDYTGAVAATGTVFQSSYDTGQPATFSLSQVIPGWTEGIPGMKVGGTRRLLIPAAKAYGANPPQGSNIPANADLVFDVTLESIGAH
ncbi:MAG TPA: FKBP-type peptidyl-prolyl cis-trans isomerase [Candidatus Saccharimonadales bacterium]|nr:FKBP-type peptidyl-prolyl cis-trans isomerase [Candidatus Saccharimonadales bacterium]